MIDMSSARAYFPFVGLMLGAIIGGLDLLFQMVFPALLTGALLVVMLILLTRALHLDGFMDSCDGLFGGFTPERRLEIMRDSRVGAFAVIGCVSLLIIKLAAIVGLPPAIRTPILVLFPCLSRWGLLMNMQLYPYARAQGFGTAFQAERVAVGTLIGLATAVVASVLIAGIGGIIMLLTVTAVAWGLGCWMSGLLDGGLTGDSYGALNEVGEVIALLTALLVGALALSLFGSPISLLV